jgi:hypothetical protein
MVGASLRGVVIAVAIAGCAFEHGADPSGDDDAIEGRSGTVEFRRGDNGYAGVADTSLMVNNADVPQGDVDIVTWEQQSEEDALGLVRFDAIFGTSAAQIPPSAQIVTAQLHYVVTNSGDSAELHEVLVDWSESITYASFGAASGAQPLADYRSEIVALADGASTGPHVVDVTSSLRQWSLDPVANRGWIFVPLTDAGTRFASSEAAVVDRPRLVVTFGP